MTIVYHHRTLMDGAEGVHIAEMLRAFQGLGYRVEAALELAKTVVTAAAADTTRERRVS
jgi:hypothetical protein